MKRKQVSTKILWKNIDLFNYNLGFCPDEKAWDEHWKTLVMKKGMCKPDYPDAFGATVIYNEKHIESNDKQSSAIVVVNSYEGMSFIDVAGILAHESIHVMQDISERIGETKFSSETEAYLMQGIIVDLLRMYYEVNK